MLSQVQNDIYIFQETFNEIIIITINFRPLLDSSAEEW